MDLKESLTNSRMERKKEETRQKIIKVAMDLFRRQGVAPTTMEQIAQEVDIAKGTLYNYFPVKEAIIEAYIQRANRAKNPDRLQHLAQLPDTRARMRTVLGELMTGIQAQPEIFEKFMIYRTQSIISLQKTEGEHSGVERLGTEIIRLGQANGEIRTDLPFGVLEDHFEFILVEIYKQFYAAPEAFDARQTIEQCIDLFMCGVQPKPS